MKHILLLCLILLLTLPIAAENDPLPNNSVDVAVFFGDISEEPSFIQKLQPAWEVGDERNFQVLDIAAGQLSDCLGRIILITDNIVFWYDTSENLQFSDFQ